MPTPKDISTTPNMVDTELGKTWATMVKLEERKAELPTASIILMRNESAMKVLTWEMLLFLS